MAALVILDAATCLATVQSEATAASYSAVALPSMVPTWAILLLTAVLIALMSR